MEGDPTTIDDAVRRLTRSIQSEHRAGRVAGRAVPDRNAIIQVVHDLRKLLFPGLIGDRTLARDDVESHVRTVLTRVAPVLKREVAAGLAYGRAAGTGSDLEGDAARIVAILLNRLPEIRARLDLDIQAAYDGDPAAQHTDEIVLCYPGLFAMSVYRIAHRLYREGVPLVPRIMAEYAHAKTGIDIHPGASIGRSFFIDHGTGVVIGETTVIGDHCRVYQGVTLGAKGFDVDGDGRVKRGGRRHPTLEDHVSVFAGATILGGDTTIGAGSIVNGGVFLTTSVPPGHVVRGPMIEITLRSNPKLPPGSYAI